MSCSQQGTDSQEQRRQWIRSIPSERALFSPKIPCDQGELALLSYVHVTLQTQAVPFYVEQDFGVKQHYPSKQYIPGVILKIMIFVCYIFNVVVIVITIIIIIIFTTKNLGLNVRDHAEVGVDVYFN